MYNRKNYDKDRAKRLYQEFKKRRELMLDKLGGICFLCEKKAEKGFNLHHVEYHETESNYPRHSKSMYVRLKRLEEAEKNPDRFKLLCPKCHWLITSIETSIKDIKREKLVELLSSSLPALRDA